MELMDAFSFDCFGKTSDTLGVTFTEMPLVDDMGVCAMLVDGSAEMVPHCLLLEESDDAARKTKIEYP